MHFESAGQFHIIMRPHFLFIITSIHLVQSGKERLDNIKVLRLWDSVNPLVTTVQSMVHSSPSTHTDNHIGNVYAANSYIFPYYDSAISKSYPLFSPEFSYVILTTSDLMCSTNHHHEKDNTWYYYSGNLFQPEFSHLQSVLHPRHLFKRKVLPKVSSNVWIGGEGVHAPAHYDAVNNVYVQLTGSKRFRLLPPSAAVKHARFYGRHHPYACQSRVSDLSTGEGFVSREELIVLSEYYHSLGVSIVDGGDDDDDDDGSSASDGGCDDGPTHAEDTSTGECSVTDSSKSQSPPFPAYHDSLIEVTLYPGDVLLIPPFWLHEATALDCSLSVSHWWDASQLDVMDDVYLLPLPFEAEWDTERTVVTAFLFVSGLVGAIDASVPGSRNTVYRLLKERYTHDWAIYTAALKDNNSVNAVSDDLARFTNIGEEKKELYFSVALLQKIDKMATEKFAPLFVTGFIESDTVYESLSETLKSWDDDDDDDKRQAVQGRFHEAPSSNTAASTCGKTDSKNGSLDPSGTCSMHLVDGTPSSRSGSGSEGNDIEEDDNTTVHNNKVAVMHMKLCDYMEDVFLYIAQSRYKNAKGEPVDGAVGDLPRAVLLLFQFLKVSADGKLAV